MMREIKFRAWDKKFKRMFYFGFEDIRGDYDGVPTVSHKFNDKENAFIELTNLKEVEIVLFTGLKDKNGKEIYEGDIVKVPEHYENDRLIPNHEVLVAFSEGQWSLVNLQLKGNQYIFDLHEKVINDRVEVMGNIYENPELLEGKCE